MASTPSGRRTPSVSLQFYSGLFRAACYSYSRFFIYTDTASVAPEQEGDFVFVGRPSIDFPLLVIPVSYVTGFLGTEISDDGNNLVEGLPSQVSEFLKVFLEQSAFRSEETRNEIPDETASAETVYYREETPTRCGNISADTSPDKGECDC